MSQESGVGAWEQGTRLGGLVGPQGENAGGGGSQPNRFEQLFSFCIPRRLPVLSAPEVRGNAYTT